MSGWRAPVLQRAVQPYDSAQHCWHGMHVAVTRLTGTNRVWHPAMPVALTSACACCCLLVTPGRSPGDACLTGCVGTQQLGAADQRQAGSNKVRTQGGVSLLLHAVGLCIASRDPGCSLTHLTSSGWPGFRTCNCRRLAHPQPPVHHICQPTTSDVHGSHLQLRVSLLHQLPVVRYLPLCRHAVEACLSSLLSASLSKEAAAAERMATLEGSLASLAAASASAQATLAEATNKGEWALLLVCGCVAHQHAFNSVCIACAALTRQLLCEA